MCFFLFVFRNIYTINERELTMLVYLAVGAIILVIVRLIILFRSDADALVLFYAKYGASPSKILKGKVVWITGASSGIGEHLAYQLAGYGCKLILSARRKDELERVKEKCIGIATDVGTEQRPADYLVCPLDLTDFDSHERLTKEVLEHFGQIDILINNGGRSQRGMVIDTPGLSVDKAMMDLNVFGCISMTKAVLPHMVARKQGHIMVTSSAAGKIGAPLSATYCATKFALQGYFDALRIEVHQHNIAVTLACPGPIQSNIVKNAFTEDVSVSYEDKVNIKDDNERMPTERCAKLIIVGIVNKLDELWISPNPVLFFMYARQYLPNVCSYISKRIGIKQIQKMRERTEITSKKAE